VATTDQFWSRTATVRKPNELCVPSRRTPLDECCVPRPTRCQVAGTDAGPCDTPPLQAACDAAGGSCRSVLCDERCGNGVLEPWCCEECDDGTRFEGDGCSSQCKIQPCCIPQPTRCSLAPDVPCDGDDDCERAGAAGA
jgi:cysteine-rich repeat protein